MRKNILILLVLCVPLLGFGQFKINTQSKDLSTNLNPQSDGMGQGIVSFLGLDPSRVSMQHSYSMGFSSFGGNNYSQGMYLNTLKYQFSIPLTVSVQWGIANQMLPGLNASPMMSDGPFLSGAQVLYKPTKNTVLRLEYQQIPNSYRYGGYRSPFGYNRYRDSLFDDWDF